MNNKLIDPETGLFCRSGEKVGGGFFIFRRGAFGNRIKPSKAPFEHTCIESARKERDKLREHHPDGKYHIFQQID